jgi:hypothetical protein
MEFRASDLFNQIGRKEHKFEARLVESIIDFRKDELTGDYARNSLIMITGGEPNTISKFSIDRLKWYANNWGYHVWKDEYENVYRFRLLSLMPK